MRKVIFISSGVLLLILMGMYISFAANKTSMSKNDNKTDNLKRNSVNNKELCCCTRKPESGKISDNSIYQLKSIWKNELNKNIRLSDFRGRHIVLAMIFANCTYACPVIINDMKRIENKISSREVNNTKFVLVSIDPDRDSPESLLNLSKRENLDLNRWSLLTSTKDNVRELAAMFGFQYQKNKNGDYIHSNQINILNPDGEIVYQYQGLNQDISLAVEKIGGYN
jgi:protein SCO1/2